MQLFNMIFCAAAYILNRLLLQLKEPTEAAKVKMPTGKKVRQRLDSWWAELEPQYFEDDVCDSPRPRTQEDWTEEPEKAEVSPWRAVYGSPL